MTEEQYISLKFEREALEGVVAVGTYLSDAAKRIGVRSEGSCSIAEGVHHCRMEVLQGGELLSEDTSVEKEYFAEIERKMFERLGCVAKFDRAGEATIMTKEKEEPIEDEAAREEAYRKKFAELPLERKISQLMQLEAIALSDTLSFVADSPYKVANKVMDVMAGFGLKKERSEKDAVRPEEHKAAAESENEENKSE